MRALCKRKAISYATVDGLLWVLVDRHQQSMAIAVESIRDRRADFLSRVLDGARRFEGVWD